MTLTPTSQTVERDEACIAIDAHAIGPAVADTVSTALKAVADPLRLRMLSYVASSTTGEACVCDLAALTEVAQPTVSHHLKLLREAGILTSERRGTWVWYRVAPGYRRAVSTLLETFAPATLAPPAPGPLVGSGRRRGRAGPDRRGPRITASGSGPWRRRANRAGVLHRAGPLGPPVRASAQPRRAVRQAAAGRSDPYSHRAPSRRSCSCASPTPAAPSSRPPWSSTTPATG